MWRKVRKRVEKKRKWALKCWLLKKGSKSLNSALKSYVHLPLVFKVDFCIQKWILSAYFITLLAIALRKFVFHIFSLLANTPSPVTTLYFYLECYVFQFVEFGIGMTIWCLWFSHLSSDIPFMRSYLYTCINNPRKCLLC